MTAEEIFRRIQRVMMLDDGAIIEVRDDARFTPVCAAALVASALFAGIGAFLYGEFVLDAGSLGFTDTAILGTLFTILLFLAGIGVMYIMLTVVFRVDLQPEGLVRVAALTHLPYALGLFVFLEEIGFAFGIASVALTFFYTVYALGAAAPRATALQVVLSVLAGFALWSLVIPIISDPGDNFVTGVFVYSLIA
jgi:hypothetical protein